MKFVALSLVLLLILSLQACSNTPQLSPQEYNNTIVDEQNKIIEKILAYSNLSGVNPEKAEKKRIEAIKQCEASLKVVQDLPDYNGDLELRDAAIELFLFYRKMTEESFKEIGEIVAKGEEITTEDMEKLMQLETAMEKKEIILDNALSKAQIRFSKKYNFNLSESSVQKEIDSLLEE